MLKEELFLTESLTDDSIDFDDQPLIFEKCISESIDQFKHNPNTPLNLNLSDCISEEEKIVIIEKEKHEKFGLAVNKVFGKLVVSLVIPDSKAEQAGLVIGDAIELFNGQKIENTKETAGRRHRKIRKNQKKDIILNKRKEAEEKAEQANIFDLFFFKNKEKIDNILATTPATGNTTPANHRRAHETTKDKRENISNPIGLNSKNTIKIKKGRLLNRDVNRVRSNSKTSFTEDEDDRYDENDDFMVTSMMADLTNLYQIELLIGNRPFEVVVHIKKPEKNMKIGLLITEGRIVDCVENSFSFNLGVPSDHYIMNINDENVFGMTDYQLKKKIASYQEIKLGLMSAENLRETVARIGFDDAFSLCSRPIQDIEEHSV